MLGPPVCLPCRRVYDHLEEEEWQELRKTRPDIGRWWCSKCGREDSTDCVFTLTREVLRTIEGFENVEW